MKYVIVLGLLSIGLFIGGAVLANNGNIYWMVVDPIGGVLFLVAVIIAIVKGEKQLVLPDDVMKSPPISYEPTKQNEPPAAGSDLTASKSAPAPIGITFPAAFNVSVSNSLSREEAVWLNVYTAVICRSTANSEDFAETVADRVVGRFNDRFRK